MEANTGPPSSCCVPHLLDPRLPCGKVPRFCLGSANEVILEACSYACALRAPCGLAILHPERRSRCNIDQMMCLGQKSPVPGREAVSSPCLQPHMNYPSRSSSVYCSHKSLVVAFGMSRNRGLAGSLGRTASAHDELCFQGNCRRASIHDIRRALDVAGSCQAHFQLWNGPSQSQR